LKKKFNIPTHQQTILVATNPIQFDEKIKFVADACEALYDENRFILIRIHPSENISDYAFLKQQYSNLHITGSHEQTAEESLAISDCIVCHNTVFLLEALIKRIPVYIFAPSYISYPLGVGEDAYRAGAAMLSNTITELKSQIGNTLSTKNIEAGESYVNSICNYFGDDAAKRIYTELKKTA
jgi:hypothetical protein